MGRRTAEIVSREPPGCGIAIAAPGWNDGGPSTEGEGLAEKTTSRSLAAVVLAAGKGKRLKSSSPKVLHPVCGRPVLWHTLQAVKAARPTTIVIVVSHGAAEVTEAVKSWGIKPAPVFVDQGKPLGTGHAVLAAERAVGEVDDVLVANGDFDPVRSEDVRALVSMHRRRHAAATLLSTILRDPGGYGRVVRDGPRVVDVVEGIDAGPEVRRIDEVATNWVAIRRDLLFATLPVLDRNNKQREYYLNRAISILIAKGEQVEALLADTGGTLGINTRGGLAELAKLLRRRINERHMTKGVTLVDPDTTYIDVDVKIGADTMIQPNTFLRGATVIGAACEIGPSVSIVDSRVGDRSTVTFATMEETRIGRDVEVGPFARLRGGTKLADGAKVGSYVEIKGSTIGERSKVPHLSYVGDAAIGKDVNVGAGAITANWDGYGKHRTSIGDGARIGSDTMLVAPVRVGKGGVTGAGSVVSKDVPAGALAVERSEQKNVKGYRARKDAEHRGKRGGH